MGLINPWRFQPWGVEVADQALRPYGLHHNLHFLCGEMHAGTDTIRAPAGHEYSPRASNNDIDTSISVHLLGYMGAERIAIQLLCLVNSKA